MIKLIKGLFLFLLFGVVLVIVLGAIFAYYFDANDYKEQIISYVEERSKRSVELETLNLSLFPSLGLAATRLKVGENPDFGNAPFLEAEEIQLGLKLLPLLRQEAEVDGIILKSIKVNIMRNARGQFNFDDLKALTAADQNTNDDTAADASQALALTSFGGVALKEGYLLWDDRLNDARIAINNINFESGSLFSNKPTPIALSADINSLAGDLKDLNASIELNTKLLPDLSKGNVKISDVQLQMKLNQSGKALAAHVNGKIAPFELKDGVLSAGKAIPIEIDARADGLSEDIKALSASFNMKAELLPNSQENTIQAANLTALAQAKGLDENLSLQLIAKDNRALLEGTFIADQFKIAYGDIQVEGSGSFSDLYGNPKADISVPVFDYDALQLKQILLKSSMVGDKILLNLQRADFHQGRISGNVDVNLASNAYQMRLLADEVPIDKMQAALSADGQATVRGQAQLKLALTGILGDLNQMLESSDGKADVRITKGALQDESLAAIIERVVAFLEGRARSTSGKEIIFDEMHASVVLNKGIAKNDNLAVQMPLLDVKGAGQVDLVNSKIDYTLHTRLQSNERIQIPIRIVGDLESPDYKPDLSNLIKHELLDKSGIKEKIEEKTDDIKQEIQDKIKGNLLEGLKDKLKSPL